MGADGGTIPKRCELVQKKKKVEKLERAVKNATKWRTCQISQQPLKKPIIACRFGRLYNKETVIEAILNKKIGTLEGAAHIRGMKDVKELKLTENKDFKEDGVKGDSYMDHNQTPFLCPVTSVPMNGNTSFVVNWKCGCVFSEKALQEVKSDFCHGCGGPWDVKESVTLYPNEETLDIYKQKLATEISEKKAKKDKKAAKEESPETSTNGVTVDEKKKNGVATTNGVNGEKVKKGEKRKADVTLQDDPTKSDAYKKLFTTCEAAKNKPEGHWVTYNPLFY